MGGLRFGVFSNTYTHMRPQVAKLLRKHGLLEAQQRRRRDDADGDDGAAAGGGRGGRKGKGGRDGEAADAAPRRAALVEPNTERVLQVRMCMCVHVCACVCMCVHVCACVCEVERAWHRFRGAFLVIIAIVCTRSIIARGAAPRRHHIRPPSANAPHNLSTLPPASPPSPPPPPSPRPPTTFLHHLLHHHLLHHLLPLPLQALAGMSEAHAADGGRWMSPSEAAAWLTRQLGAAEALWAEVAAAQGGGAGLSDYCLVMAGEEDEKFFMTEYAQE